MKARNVMEDIAKKYLDEILITRFDVCKCAQCREDMIAYTLSRIPPRYVTTESGTLQTIMEQQKVEHASEVLKELVNAIKVVSQNPHRKIVDDENKAYEMLMRQIKLDRGVDFSQYRDRVLKRRIALRMRACNVNSYSEYLQVLIHNSAEYEELFEVLTINVSSFFRDQQVWDALKTRIFPGIIEQKKQKDYKKIHIWSAGCAGGEEPYSLAILLYELLEREGDEMKAEITATDIDKESIRDAEKGLYDRGVLKNVSSYYLKRFFIPIKDKYLVAPQIKSLVKFKQHDLIQGIPIAGVDLVICRNVFIYFNRSLQEHLIMKFYNALVLSGYFVMGNSENMLGEARQLFSVVDGDCRIFQKIKIAT
ncbi:MAG: late competence development ComFB family protein [Candidatus Omnitrophica bacterium]|nr:late competence development ComFB family protein [Candidatus Omnitrophota bacterium]MBU1925507.1 late competence development ComFB family protein [Candidatus Omnitrophota bacterium]